MEDTPKITENEKDIFERLLNGMPTAAIGRLFGIASPTVFKRIHKVRILVSTLHPKDGEYFVLDFTDVYGLQHHNKVWKQAFETLLKNNKILVVNPDVPPTQNLS